MSAPVSKRLQLRVLDVLRTADTPLKTSEVAMLVNRSYEATRQALELVGAKRVDTSFPTEWIIDSAHTPAQVHRVPGKHNDAEYTIGVPVVPDPIVIWNEKREVLGQAITKFEITPDSNPREMAEMLGNAAGRMAYLAYKLDEYATRPDWYDTLSKEG